LPEKKADRKDHAAAEAIEEEVATGEIEAETAVAETGDDRNR
jgi:hypothetical protein